MNRLINHRKVKKVIISNIIDWCGTDVKFIKDPSPDYLIVKLKVNQNAMYYWAMQYSEFVEILEPLYLINRIKNTLSESLSNYF